MSNSNYILTSDGSFISDEALYHKKDHANKIDI